MHIVLPILSGIALSFAIYYAIVASSTSYEDRLMQQCMATGKPEFECYGLIKKGNG